MCRVKGIPLGRGGRTHSMAGASDHSLHLLTQRCWLWDLPEQWGPLCCDQSHPRSSTFSCASPSTASKNIRFQLSTWPSLSQHSTQPEGGSAVITIKPSWNLTAKYVEGGSGPSQFSSSLQPSPSQSHKHWEQTKAGQVKLWCSPEGVCPKH